MSKTKAERSKEYRDRHNKKLRADGKAFRDANKNNPNYIKKRREYDKKFCDNHPKERRKAVRDYYKNNKEKVNSQSALNRMSGKGRSAMRKAHKKFHLKSMYGITIEQFEQMRIAQGNRCAICNSEFQFINIKTGKKYTCSVDHDHNTGKIRQLLCDRCNKVLGFMEESPTLLKSMIDYINKWK